ncbi:MAG: deoxyribodipyrimidine photo-lyase [Planctomycetota bacterium]
MHWPSTIQPRLKKLKQHEHVLNRDYVLVWIRQTLRGEFNPAIDAAVLYGNRHGLPVVVYHGIDNRYPYASARLHTFVLQASASMESRLSQRQIRFCRHIRRPGKPSSNLVLKLTNRSAALFVDYCNNDWLAQICQSVIETVDVPCWSVDTTRLVPGSMFEKKVATTKAFRSKHTSLREIFQVCTEEDTSPSVDKFSGPLPIEGDSLTEQQTSETSQIIVDCIAQCDIDQALPSSGQFPGDRGSALKRLKDATVNIVARYKWTRNNASLPKSTTRLSPYLHFGVLSPVEVARAIEDADLHSAAKWKFLDELLTWREHYHHLADHSDSFASYLNVPRWARATLDAHRNDERSQPYSLSELMHARTSDATWNAAQLQFLCDGWMHNNLRMYWAKQIIKFRPSPEDAWATACYLNDRLSLDGRDASTYGGIQWAFGHAKPAHRESPIYGWVTTKTDSAICKRTDMSEWIEMQSNRSRPQLECPDSPPIQRYTKGI